MMPRFVSQCAGFALILALSAGCTSQSGSSVPSLAQPAAMPLVSGQDLLYVVRATNYTDPGKLSLYTYPQAQHRKTVDSYLLSTGGPACADDSGNIYVVGNTIGSVYGYILVYAHGKTTPARTISGYYFDYTGCAVDPTSGDLAVTFTGENGVLVYPNATGTPKYYVYPPHFRTSGCTFDDGGNLFVGGAWLDETNRHTKRYPLRLLELPRGESTFINVKFPRIHWASTTPGDLDWDGKHLAFANGADSIYRVAVSGSDATIAGITKLQGANGIRTFWIQGGALAAATGPGVVIWKYPAGGKATATIRGAASGVAVSVPGAH